MLSKQKIKFIHSLDQKKNRKKYGVFLAEGEKLILDIYNAFSCKFLFASSSWLAKHPYIQAEEIFEITEEDLTRLSLLKTPKDVLAVFYIPDIHLEDIKPESHLVLMLDGIQDPGNLGTIVRSADWFGIEHIICSPDTADIFNPKAVQATMGAISRVKLHYTSLPEYLDTISNTPVYGTFLEGENIYEQTLSQNGIIILGNEGNGIRPEIASHVTKKLLIPCYPKDQTTSESLNVGVAASIICSEFRRRISI